jgi:hypothetical protein
MGVPRGLTFLTSPFVSGGVCLRPFPLPLGSDADHAYTVAAPALAGRHSSAGYAVLNSLAGI